MCNVHATLALLTALLIVGALPGCTPHSKPATPDASTPLPVVLAPPPEDTLRIFMSHDEAMDALMIFDPAERNRFGVVGEHSRDGLFRSPKFPGYLIGLLEAEYGDHWAVTCWTYRAESPRNAPADPHCGEHMWVSYLHWTGQWIVGKLTGEPTLANLRPDQRVRAPLARLSDWVSVIDAKASGGFTLPRVLARVPEAEATALRSQQPFSWFATLS